MYSNHGSSVTPETDGEFMLAHSSMNSSMDDLDAFDELGCSKLAEKSDWVFGRGEDEDYKDLGGGREGYTEYVDGAPCTDPHLCQVIGQKAEVSYGLQEKMVITLTSGVRHVNVNNENTDWKSSTKTPEIPNGMTAEKQLTTPSIDKAMNISSEAESATPSAQKRVQDRSSKNERASNFYKETMEKSTKETALPKRSPQVYKRKERVEDKENFAIPKIPTPKKSSRKNKTPPMIELFSSCSKYFLGSFQKSTIQRTNYLLLSFQLLTLIMLITNTSQNI